MNKILFIDTLTTGLNNERCAIYRMGGIFCEESSDKLIEKKKFDLCIRPFEGARILDNSIWIGGITRSQLIYFPEQSEVFEQFLNLIKEHINMASSKDKLYLSGFDTSAFDMPFIRNWFVKNNNQRFRDCFHLQTLDLMSLSAFALLNERPTMEGFHLETVAKYLGVTPVKNEKYSCLDNASTCLQIYLKLKNRLGTGDNSTYITTNEIVRNHKLSL